MVLGRLPTAELNELLYRAISGLHEAADALAYIGILIRPRGKE